MHFRQRKSFSGSVAAACLVNISRIASPPIRAGGGGVESGASGGGSNRSSLIEISLFRLVALPIQVLVRGDHHAWKCPRFADPPVSHIVVNLREVPREHPHVGDVGAPAAPRFVTHLSGATLAGRRVTAG